MNRRCSPARAPRSRSSAQPSSRPAPRRCCTWAPARSSRRATRPARAGHHVAGSSGASPISSSEPDAPIVTVCRDGQQSLLAAATLSELGYSNVRALQGGTNAWRAAGLDLELGLSGVLSVPKRRTGLRPGPQLRRYAALPPLGDRPRRKVRDLRAPLGILRATQIPSPSARRAEMSRSDSGGLLTAQVAHRAPIGIQCSREEAICDDRPTDRAILPGQRRGPRPSASK